MAKRARQARQDVIGRVFDPDLASIDGETIDLNQLAGKVILMPFWSIGSPDSLQVFPLLVDIRKRYPKQVEIVGMNLDPEDAPLPEFLSKVDLQFVSYHSPSSSESSGTNPAAEQFGLVSMPFVAILDQEARVVALDFTGTRIESVVDQLIDTDVIVTQGSSPNDN